MAGHGEGKGAMRDGDLQNQPGGKIREVTPAVEATDELES